jgi:DNA-binding GntR family transcriptional regulator
MNDLPQLSPATRIVDTVQDALRDAIFGGSLRAGEALSVPELARRLNVSRSPVREAVLGLVAQGLAVEQPRRGVVVATIEADDLVAIHEVREFL